MNKGTAHLLEEEAYALLADIDRALAERRITPREATMRAFRLGAGSAWCAVLCALPDGTPSVPLLQMKP